MGGSPPSSVIRALAQVGLGNLKDLEALLEWADAFSIFAFSALQVRSASANTGFEKYRLCVLYDPATAATAATETARKAVVGVEATAPRTAELRAGLLTAAVSQGAGIQFAGCV